jgi:copper resistance protein B
MKRLLLIGLMPLVIAAPAAAQDMPGMPGMKMPMPAAKPSAKPAAKRPPVKKPAKRKAAPVAAKKPAPPAASAMPGMSMEPAKPASVQDMATMPMAGADATATQPGMAGMNMKQADQPGGPDTATSEPEIPKSPPPPPPKDYAADRYYEPSAMASARGLLRAEHGDTATFKIMANIAEFEPRSGGQGGYRWDGQAWYGGDINRFVLKTEGEGSGSDGVGNAEVQALFSRAIGPYTDVQAGIRRDFEPGSRTYAAVGFQTLLPYWFEVEGSAYISTDGEVLGRVEGSYDLRLTQRLVLQPRAELNFAAQDIAETHTGSGLSDAELGLRLRYEIRREFAPYIGITYDRKFGGTADFAKVFGEDTESTRFVIGIRAWF